MFHALISMTTLYIFVHKRYEDKGSISCSRLTLKYNRWMKVRYQMNTTLEFAIKMCIHRNTTTNDQFDKKITKQKASLPMYAILRNDQLCLICAKYYQLATS